MAEAAELYDGPESEPEATATQPAPRSASPRLLELAADLGVTEAKDMDPDRLADVVHVLSKRAAKEWGQQQRQQDVRAVHDRINNPPAPHVAPVEVDELKELEADMDPRLVSVLKKQRDENRQLRESLGLVAERDRQREERTVVDVIDNAFDSLKDDRFGEGAAREMDPDDLCRKRRGAILNAAVANGLNLKTASARKIASTIRETVALLSPAPKAPARVESDNGYDVEDRPARRAPAKDPGTGRFLSREDRVGQEQDEAYATVLARPTHRAEKKLPPGDERAINAVSQLLPSMNGASDGNQTGYVTRDDF